MIELDYFSVFVLDVRLEFFDLFIEVLDGLITQLHLHCLLLQILYQLLIFIEAIFMILPVFHSVLPTWGSLILPDPLILIENFLSIGVVW